MTMTETTNNTRARPTASLLTDARHSAWLLLIGGLLLIVGNVSHPVDSAMSATSRLPLAGHDSWVLIHLVLATGFLCIALGFGGVQRLITQGRARAYARSAAMFAVIGGALLFTVFAGLDGFGQHSLAPAWNAAGTVDRVSLEAAAIALNAVDTGMAAAGTLALLGFAMLGLGAALYSSRVLGAWIGPLALVVGAAGSVTGVLMLSLGATELTINALMRPVGMAFTLFVLALGVVLRRRA